MSMNVERRDWGRIDRVNDVGQVPAMGRGTSDILVLLDYHFDLATRGDKD
jgi:hypothetical protein